MTPITASTVWSKSSSVESTVVTPSAAVMKSTTFASAASRRRICSPTSAVDEPTSSAERRAARTPSSAVSRMRTGASGATTVVMSRPSTTMPGRRVGGHDRPEQLDQVRAHLGHARHAADDRRDPRVADRVGHVGLADVHGVPGRVGADAVVEAREARDDGCLVIGVDARRLGVPRERPIGRAGVEEPVAETPRHLFRHARLAAARGSVDGDHEWDDE